MARMGHAGVVHWLSSRLSRQRLLLLAAFVLPLAAVATLLLRARARGAVLRRRRRRRGRSRRRRRAPPHGRAGRPDAARLEVGGRSRAVLVQDPLGGQPARGLVVVLGPHSLSAARTAVELRFDELRARGYAVAYPSTLDGDWNAGRCCGTPQAAGVDDVAFLQEVRQPSC